jgi:hypothetical protein
MTRTLILDTDILIDYLRGQQEAVSFVSRHLAKAALPSMVVGELYAGVKGEHELDVLDRFVELFRIIPLTPEIARTGGLLKQQFGKSHGLGLADAMIAATAQHEDATLTTLNTKHYPMFSDLAPPYVKPG